MSATAREKDSPPEAQERRPAARRVGRAIRRGRAASWVRPSGYYLGLAGVTSLGAMGFLGMFTRPLGAPLVYSGDALSGGSQFKGVLENGWYEHNPDLGAPFGQNMHDFPLADNLQFVLARVFGLISDQWAVVYNLTYLVTFPLAAVAAAWFIRVAGGGRVTAFGFGCLYAFTPYHFVHGQPHLALSMFFVVPLFAGLLMKVLSGRALWVRRSTSSPRNPLSWLTPTSLGTVAVVGLMGTTSSYYSVFGLLLASLVLAVTVVRRRWRHALGLVLAMGALVVVMLVNMAPDILFARSVATSPAAFGRPAVHSELYALKFAQLVFPVPWHRIDALASFRNEYDQTFPHPAEHPALGVVAAVGFLVLLVAPLAVTLRRLEAKRAVLGGAQQHLALLTLGAFLIGTTGGLGTVFALLVSPDIRAWNRIVTYLALFGLTAVALLTEALVRRMRSHPALQPDLTRRGPARFLLRKPAEALAVALTATLLGVGLWDAAPPPSSTESARFLEDWRNDSAYVTAIEDEVPPGTQVFELPYLAYPEADPSSSSDMQPYDPMRPYLHSSTLSWSYGGVQGRPRADWQATISELTPRRLAVALAASGFGGIHVDRLGYRKQSASPELVLQEMVGTPIVSPDDRFAFYDLAPLREDIATAYSPAEIAKIKRHTIRQPVFYWQPGFTGPPAPDANGDLYLDGLSAQPEAVLDNPGAPVRMRFSFTVQAVADSYPTSVEVTWPDGTTQRISVMEDGTEISRTVTVGPGQHSFALAGSDANQVKLRNWVLRDPALSFPLRGLAAAAGPNGGAV